MRTATRYLTVFLLCGDIAAATAAEILVRHYDGVMGTTLDITLYHDDAQAAAHAADAAVAEIARLEQLLSSYRGDSELAQLNATHATSTASSELLALVQHCVDWQQQTGGKFSCRLGTLQTLWRDAEKNQQVPDRAAVRAQARAIGQAALTVDAQRASITTGEDIQLDPNGLATGYIVDKAMALLRALLPDARAIKLDAGGDALYWGTPPGQRGWQVGVADPLNAADGAALLATLNLTSRAVTASGHANRKRTIARRDFSHILQARDGWPVEQGTSAVVVAPTALLADVVATTLAVQSLSDGIDWVNTLEGVEALVIDGAGHQLRSAGWTALLAGQHGTVAASESSAAGEPAASAATFVLHYTLPEFDVASYNRPYLAIWITGIEQTARKHLLLLGENERWARENTRWWRRVGRGNPQLLDGVARPTRAPGRYQLEWSGLDDFGQPLAAGDYELHLEASREGGGSSYQKIPFHWGTTAAQAITLPADGELGAIELLISPAR